MRDTFQETVSSALFSALLKGGRVKDTPARAADLERPLIEALALVIALSEGGYAGNLDTRVASVATEVRGAAQSLTLLAWRGFCEGLPYTQRERID